MDSRKEKKEGAELGVFEVSDLAAKTQLQNPRGFE